MPTKNTRPAARIGDGTRNARRGFAGMDPERQRLLASMGGKASGESNKSHKWTKEEAAEAGRKGGVISRRGPAKPKE